MPTEEVVKLVFSFLGGGLVAGLFNLWNTNRIERKRRQVDFIRLQLQELYGPLQFFTSSNAQLFKLSTKLHEAYKIEYIDKKWSENSLAQERLNKWSSNTLEISNEYVKQVVKNNEHILEILTNHYSLIEPNDAGVFSQFLVDFIRHRIESSESGLRTPFPIYSYIGEISFMRPEFITAVDLRFNEKKKQLEKLLK